MNDIPEDGTKIIRFGKFTGVLYPEIYFLFVQKLMHEHEDIVSAMVLAKLNIKDKSAIDYFNQILGTNVLREMPMEVAYKILYDALDHRKVTQENQKLITGVAKDKFNLPFDYTYRKEEHAHKSLFPTIDEQIDRGDK
jgi:hypothetical protein